MSTPARPSPRQCQHPRIEIVERGTASTWHRRRPDGTWDHDSEFGDYTGALHVHCADCGYDRWFSPNEQRPKWLQAAILEMETAPDNSSAAPGLRYAEGGEEDEGPPPQAARGETARRQAARQRRERRVREALLALLTQTSSMAQADPELRGAPEGIREALRQIQSSADDLLALLADNA